MTKLQREILYLTEPGFRINKEGQTLIVEHPEGKRNQFPIRKIQAIECFGPSAFTPQSLELCFNRNVPIVWFSVGGRLLRSDSSGAQVAAATTLRQVKLIGNMRGITIARNIVAEKINAQESILTRSFYESDDDASREQLAEAKKLLNSLLKTELTEFSLDTLRGIEGRATSIYLSSLSSTLKKQRSDFHFTRRSRRPPRDPINALMSYCYALLLGDVLGAIAAIGLDSRFGVLHLARGVRPSLALDLIEPFRHSIADRLLIRLINRKQIRSKDFESFNGGVYLCKASAKVVIAEYQRFMSEAHGEDRYDATMRSLLMTFVQNYRMTLEQTDETTSLL